MWGTEFSGPQAATADSFAGRNVVICEKSRSAAEAVERVETLYRALGMDILEMEAEQHDLHAAYVSHISHITSFILSTTVLEKEREEEAIFNLAGGGFDSTVRLAKSNADTWIPIFTQNKYNILDVLREYIHQLNLFRKALERDDTVALREIITRANDIRKVLQE
jgi:prephenate dehydrogenase